jgi:hypothetical protein
MGGWVLLENRSEEENSIPAQFLGCTAIGLVTTLTNLSRLSA